MSRFKVGSIISVVGTTTVEIMELFFIFWGINFHKAVTRRTLTMLFSGQQYKQTMIITQVGDERFRKIGQVLKTPGWQVLFKDSASVLDEVLRDNEARDFINL